MNLKKYLLHRVYPRMQRWRNKTRPPWVERDRNLHRSTNFPNIFGISMIPYKMNPCFLSTKMIFTLCVNHRLFQKTIKWVTALRFIFQNKTVWNSLKFVHKNRETMHFNIFCKYQIWMCFCNFSLIKRNSDTHREFSQDEFTGCRIESLFDGSTV